MQLKKCLAALACAVVAAINFPMPTCAQQRLPANATADDIFLALRDAARDGDAATAISLAARLPDYVIASYVDYYRLKPRIRDLIAPVSEIRGFLTRYDGSAIADRLRNDWLLALGKAGDWATFDEQYPLFVLDDDVQVKCFALNSRALKGQNVANEARALLTGPRDYGQGCSDLISTLAQNHQFGENDLWVQIRQAVEAGSVTVARRAVVFTDSDDVSLQQVIDKPALKLARGPGQGRTAHALYIIAIGRAAKDNPQKAAKFLSGAAGLTAQERAIAWAEIALPASIKLMPEAVDYWRKARNAPLSYKAYQWKARTALRAGDWKTLRATIEAMPAALRNDMTWTYWLARAQKEQGQIVSAQRLFRSIASSLSFYGQLATEELGWKIVIPPGPAPLTQAEIAPMTQNAGFRRALKFYALNMRYEGIREWNWELRKMNDRQLLAAAEFARQNDVLDRMVSTSDRTRQEMDFTQRFPVPYLTRMNTSTRKLGLESAWVYGLIRQESRFIRNARSSVGASGLMQLMPATAQYVARKIGLTGFTQNQIDDIDTNLLLGTSYLGMVLGNFDGSPVQATAAYNAGPRHARGWRSTLSRPVEGAIFAESIPFGETRAYVKNVMSDATYYAALLENRPQSLRQRLGMVAPRANTATELP
ncbi:MAG: transglycosylase SLT domain-containing protein [Herbaspirillum sp.]